MSVITDASLQNPYTIRVMSGEFSITSTLTVKSYVTIKGNGGTTILKPTGDIDMLYMSDATAISSVSLNCTTHPTEQSITELVEIPSTTNELKWVTFDLDVSNLYPRYENGLSDMLFVSIERADDDDHSDNISLITISADYL